MFIQAADADMLEDGGNTDYRFPQGRGEIYEPVKVDQRLKDGDQVRLGTTEITARIITPVTPKGQRALPSAFKRLGEHTAC